jgi:tRNA(Ile)-lysidine synthase
VGRFAAGLLERCTFPPAGTAVVCAVSGGADSLALLALAVAHGCEVEAVHVDHRLRLGSEAEAEVVEAAARRYGAGFRALTAPVDHGPNLEERAREARRAVLPADALTGHTADDQAETVLLNLLRGSGLDGLAGMAPATHPILGLRRAETAAMCEAEGLEPVQDPSNADLAFRRNRLRHEVLPQLCEVAGRDLVPVLARQALLMRSEAALLDELAAQIDPTDAAGLAAAPLALARRAVRAWLRDGPGGGRPPSAAAVERVLAVAHHEAVATEVGDGWSIRRSEGRLRLEHVLAAPARGTDGDPQ